MIDPHRFQCCHYCKTQSPAARLIVSRVLGRYKNVSARVQDCLPSGRQSGRRVRICEDNQSIGLGSCIAWRNIFKKSFVRRNQIVGNIRADVFGSSIWASKRGPKCAFPHFAQRLRFPAGDAQPSQQREHKEGAQCPHEPYVGFTIQAGTAVLAHPRLFSSSTTP